LHDVLRFVWVAENCEGERSQSRPVTLNDRTEGRAVSLEGRGDESTVLNAHLVGGCATHSGGYDVAVRFSPQSLAVRIPPNIDQWPFVQRSRATCCMGKPSVVEVLT